MASRNEVLTLFGATPEQIAAKQRQEQLAMVMSQQDPFARAGSALGFGLARLFGGESADVIEARKLQGAKEGLNLTTEEGMRDAAKRLQAAGFEDRALQLLDMADRKATSEQARDISQIKIVDKQVTVPVSTVDEFGETRTTAVKINEHVALGDQGDYYDDAKQQGVHHAFQHHGTHQFVNGNVVGSVQRGAAGHLSDTRGDQVDQIGKGHCRHRLWLGGGVAHPFDELDPPNAANDNGREANGQGKQEPGKMGRLDVFPHLRGVDFCESPVQQEPAKRRKNEVL